MHVSPFFEMDHEYLFEFESTAQHLRASIENRRDGKRVFSAGFQVEQAAVAGSVALPQIARHLLMPHETMFGIYFQALRLQLKGAPFQRHPADASHETEPGVSGPPSRGVTSQ